MDEVEEDKKREKERQNNERSGQRQERRVYACRVSIDKQREGY